MLDALPDQARIAALIEAASELTGLPLADLAANGPAASLSDTRAAQPLLFIADVAWAETAEAAGLVPVAVAGHSLGELAALAFAGVFTVEDGLALVCERARIMGEVAAEAAGGMAAVIGLAREELAIAVARIPGVWVANDNSRGQVVISGTADGIQVASAALLEAGARKVVPLAVAGPFHSPLMEAARARFAETLAGIGFADARFDVYQNTDPTPSRDADTIKDRLVGQITSPVRWTETMDALVADGVEVVVECGPGGVLTGLAKRVEGLKAFAAESEGIERLLEVTAG